MPDTRTGHFQPKAVPSGRLGEAIQAALDVAAPDLSIDHLKLTAQFQRAGQPPQPITDLYAVCLLNTAGLVVRGSVRRQSGLAFELAGHQHYVTLSVESISQDTRDGFFDTLVAELQLTPGSAAGPLEVAAG
jgi:hypothetical protein